MSQNYSNSTELVVGGESYEGRKILGLRINNPTLRKEGKPVIFIESGDLILYFRVKCRLTKEESR